MLQRQNPRLDPLSFLAGRSEMARRIREFDWEAHSFGPPEFWAPSLRSALGICLQSAFPTAIYWGSELRLLYNDAWAPIPGPRHPKALGAPAHEVWSDIWHIIEPQFTHLISTGEGLFVEDQLLPMKRFGALEETYWTYSFTPIRDVDGAIGGVFNSGSETTAKVLGQRQTQFLLKLNEAFRASPDPRAARRIALRLLGQHMGVDRVGFREVDSTVSDELAVVEEWTAPGVEPAGATIRVGDFGPWAVGRLNAGRSFRMNDLRRDENGEGIRSVLEPMGVRAAMAVPWMAGGRLVAVLFLHSRAPRHWNDFELSTAEEVLERTLSWIARERAAERERIMIREIDHRARNALAVVQSVIRLTPADDLDAFRAKVEDRIAALARSHGMLAGRQWEPLELRALLKEELTPYAGDEMHRVRLDGPAVPLRPDQVQTMALLFHELATNAAKHGALSTGQGRLDVSWRRGPDGQLALDWCEAIPVAAAGGASAEEPGTGSNATGGEEAPAPEPARSGFGTVLLTRVVEQQLGGRFERRVEPGSFQCALSVPLDRIELADAPPVPSTETAPPSGTGPTSEAGIAKEAAPDVVLAGESVVDAGAHATQISGADAAARPLALLVEDEALVAMDVEAMLDDLGWDLLATAATVEEAMAALERGRPDLAILDANLGGQSSAPVAAALVERGVPVILATGYAELGDFPEQVATAPRLSKPVAEADLARAIEAVTG